MEKFNGGINPKDKHHIIFPRRLWSVYDESKKLRTNSLLIPTMERSEHEELHTHAPEIPLLGYTALRRTLIAFNNTTAHSTFQAVDNLKFAIESGVRNQGYVQRELGELAIYCLDIQQRYFNREDWHEEA